MEERNRKGYDASRKRLTDVLKRSFSLDAIKARAAGPGTGIPGLDVILRGLQSGLIVLGGMTSVGKSTLAIGIGGHIARGGTPVLYYSTEMPADRISARIIARHHFALCRQKGEPLLFSAADLYDSALPWETDARLNAAYREAYDAASGALRTVRVGGAEIPYVHAAQGEYRFMVVDGGAGDGGLSAEYIRSDALAYRDEHGQTPVVIVDYLQMLTRGRSARALSERQEVEDSIRDLVALANAGFCVLVVSSLSRSSYVGPIHEGAFKESGGIEYSASVLIGIQYAAIHQKGWDHDAEKAKPVREIELVVLKNRYGADGVVRMDYYARYDTFLARGEAAPPLAAMSSTLAIP